MAGGVEALARDVGFSVQENTVPVGGLVSKETACLIFKRTCLAHFSFDGTCFQWFFQ